MRILLVTGYASVATAVEAIKRGADDYLPKPATAPMILRTLGLVKPESVTIETTMTPLHRLEWEHIHQALHETGGNVSAAARLLGMHRRSLQRKLAKKNRGRNAKCSWTDLCGCDIRSHPWLVRVRHIVAPWNPLSGPYSPRKTLNLLRPEQNLPRECDHSSQA